MLIFSCYFVSLCEGCGPSYVYQGYILLTRSQVVTLVNVNSAVSSLVLRAGPGLTLVTGYLSTPPAASVGMVLVLVCITHHTHVTRHHHLQDGFSQNILFLSSR